MSDIFLPTTTHYASEDAKMMYAQKIEFVMSDFLSLTLDMVLVKMQK